jgi:hypothetical protein
VRGKVEQPLHDEHTMLAACTAIGRDQGAIGEHGAEAAVIGGDVVAAEERALAVERDRQAIGIVGAGVEQEVILHAEDPALSIQGQFRLMQLPTLMCRGEEMLQPVFDPLHRPVQVARSPGDQHLLRIEHHDLRPEAATDCRSDDAHLALGEAEHRGEAVADHNGSLV